jgi:hypothetical protein
MEDFVASTRNKITRGARTASYFCFGLGLVFLVSAVASYFDLHKWGLTGFIGASGVLAIVTGIFQMRVANRNTEHRAA